MKISFSTLACPDFSWAEICSAAKDFGFDGIEVRGLGAEIFGCGDDTPFSQKRIASTLNKLNSSGLCIPCISSGACLSRGDTEKAKDEIRKYISAAKKLSVKYIRVLGDSAPAPEEGVKVDDDLVCRALCDLIPDAEAAGVILLVETNGVYADSARLRALLDRIASDSVAALWDVHHPYRFFGEKPSVTVANLGMYIKHVHIKDSVMKDNRVEYRLTGEGDLPLDESIQALNSVNYEGFLSLEWVKKWIPELCDAGIVIPHYINYMSKYFADSDTSGRLYDNRAKTGKYIWKKDSLIDLTFGQLLDRVAEEFPDNYAFRFTTVDYTRTYREFRDEVDMFARALIAMGVKRGDHVAIWATNVPQWYITFWATVRIGAVLVTVNTAYKIYEAEYLLRQSDTHTLVMTDGYKDSDYKEIMTTLCPELSKTPSGKPLHSKRLPFLRNIITIESALDGCMTWDEAMGRASEADEAEVYRRAACVTKHDVCNMQYTSGTTGFPKGVMLTHYNVVNNGKNIGDCMDLSTADKMMIQVPMFHCFGMVLAMTACVTHGSCMCPIPAFSPRVALDCINKEQITAFHGVPTMFIAMLSHENFPKTDFSHMRTGIMAGSPCPVKVMQEVIDKMHMPEICITYGQTEASPGCTMSKITDSLETRVNTVGGAMYGVECKIVNPETGEEMPDGKDGEFVARGYNIMKGYYKMPEATAAAIDREGWLHTGDLARRNPDGNFKITGRIKDMIIRGGENIYPKEIEDFIYTHPKVGDVQVIGVPDEAYGEEIAAVVIVKEGETLTEEELKDYIKSHIAKHKTPRYIIFTDSFPMNAAGKILKYRMREEITEKLGLQKAGNIVTA